MRCISVPDKRQKELLALFLASKNASLKHVDISLQDILDLVQMSWAGKLPEGEKS